MQLLSQKEMEGVKFPMRIVANELNIAYGSIQKWAKLREEILGSEKSLQCRRLSSGPARLYGDIEEDIKIWVDAKRHLSLSVTNHGMASEIIRNFPDRFLSYDQCLKWTYNNIDRLDLSNRKGTHNQTKLSEAEMGSIHIDFLAHYRHTKFYHEIPDSLCVNMDETGCYFDMTSGRTLNKRGEKHINIKTTGTSKHCSIFLAVAYNGAKLKPLVVFKGSATGPMSKSLKDLDNRCCYICQEKGFCDTTVMRFWIKNCLSLYKPKEELGMIMMDNFAAHLVS